MYYEAHLSTLRDIFGVDDIALEPSALRVGSRRYPIIDDVVILLDPSQYTERIRWAIDAMEGGKRLDNFAEDIQSSFGAEWGTYGEILPEHDEEFERYFDLVDLNTLGDSRVCDLGCGSGRWSSFLRGRCRELILVDFSDAVFVARRNLRGAPALFFMGDLKRLPFRARFADFLLCLGVLHHLPTPCLEEVRALRRYAPQLLIYLYYSLDNRPRYYRFLLHCVSGLRTVLSRIRSPWFRKGFSLLGTVMIYLPMVLLGRILDIVGLGHYVPLYEFYRNKGIRRIQQDVYDRFFTRIEQRVSREQINTLSDTFPVVKISDQVPYWHFVCRSGPAEQ